MLLKASKESKRHNNELINTLKASRHSNTLKEIDFTMRIIITVFDSFSFTRVTTKTGIRQESPKGNSSRAVNSAIGYLNESPRT